MKVVFDTSVWIDHLRRDVLTPLWPRIRGRFQAHFDGWVAAELIAGCRSKGERRTVDGLLRPFARARRLYAPSAEDLRRSGLALSKLRERGLQLANPAGALIDAAIGVIAVKHGALLVTANRRDFAKLAQVLPLRWEWLPEFTQRVGAD